MTAGKIAQPENVTVAIDNAAGTPAQFESYLTSSGINVVYDTDDATAFSDLADDHTLGIRDGGNFDVSAIYTRTWGEQARQTWRCVATKTHSITYKPDGVEAHDFEALMVGFEMDTELGKTSQLAHKFKITAAITLTAAT